MATDKPTISDAAKWLFSGRSAGTGFNHKTFSIPGIDPDAPIIGHTKAQVLIAELSERTLIIKDLEGYYTCTGNDKKWIELIAELAHYGDAEILRRHGIALNPTTAQNVVVVPNRPGATAMGNVLVDPKAARKERVIKQRGKEGEPKKDDVPNPATDPKAWAWWHLSGNKDLIKKGPITVALIFIIGFVVGFVPAKVFWLDKLTQENNLLERRVERQNKDIDRLEKENAEYKTSINERATPLKRRTKILATDLRAYTLTIASEVPEFTEWRERFAPRCKMLVDELDVEGQHTDKLGPARPLVLKNDVIAASNTITVIANELERMANQLKE